MLHSPEAMKLRARGNAALVLASALISNILPLDSLCFLSCLHDLASTGSHARREGSHQESNAIRIVQRVQRYALPVCVLLALRKSALRSRMRQAISVPMILSRKSAICPPLCILIFHGARSVACRVASLSSSSHARARQAMQTHRKEP